jgi:hypothetical protein
LDERRDEFERDGEAEDDDDVYGETELEQGSDDEEERDKSLFSV